MCEGGFAPEWVMLKKDIDKMKTDLQQDLNKQCLKLITTASKYDRNHDNLMRKWVKHCENNYFHGNNEDVKRLNKTIDDYNLQEPMLQSQMFHFNVKKHSAPSFVVVYQRFHCIYMHKFARPISRSQPPGSTKV